MSTDAEELEWICKLEREARMVRESRAQLDQRLQEDRARLEQNLSEMDSETRARLEQTLREELAENETTTMDARVDVLSLSLLLSSF